MRFPQQFDDFLPQMRTVALSHIPLKENQIRPQAITDTVSHPGSLGVSSPASIGTDEDSHTETHMDCEESPLDISAPVTTDANCFGVYHVYGWKLLYNPMQCANYDLHSLEAIDPRDDYQLGMPSNSGSLHPDIQATLYYHPFSNLSVAAMMVTHHLGTSLQSLQKTTDIAHILGNLGSDLNPNDLLNFDAALENKKLNGYLASESDSTFCHEDGWLKSSVHIRLPLDKTKMAESNTAEFEVGGVFHCDILDVISSVYQSDLVQSFNHIPFKQF